jgi:four helix bundle protein
MQCSIRPIVRSYRDLVVWKKSMALVLNIYRCTQTFPKVETYGLTSQLRRAAVSVPSNIAEGQARLSTGEFKHLLGNARGSLMEIRDAAFNRTRSGLPGRYSKRLAAERCCRSRQNSERSPSIPCQPQIANNSGRFSTSVIDGPARGRVGFTGHWTLATAHWPLLLLQ